MLYEKIPADAWDNAYYCEENVGKYSSYTLGENGIENEKGLSFDFSKNTIRDKHLKWTKQATALDLGHFSYFLF